MQFCFFLKRMKNMLLFSKTLQNLKFLWLVCCFFFHTLLLKDIFTHEIHTEQTRVQRSYMI